MNQATHVSPPITDAFCTNHKTHNGIRTGADDGCPWPLKGYQQKLEKFSILTICKHGETKQAGGKKRLIAHLTIKVDNPGTGRQIAGGPDEYLPGGAIRKRAWFPGRC